MVRLLMVILGIAIGGGDNNTNYGATANGVGGTALGGRTKTTGGNFQTAVGYGATTTAQKCFCIWL